MDAEAEDKTLRTRSKGTKVPIDSLIQELRVSPPKVASQLCLPEAIVSLHQASNFCDVW